MRFLVTGGAGFIGSNIVEALLIGKARGLSPKGTVPEQVFVRVLDNFSSGKRENLSLARGLSPSEAGGTIPEQSDNFELIEGDIRDKSTCNVACRGIDYVLHQAALRSVPGSLKDPDSYNEVNIQGTLNMLQAAANNKVKRFVFASTSAIYGDTDKFPQKETDLPLLISPYALSKLTGEYHCKIFSEFFNLETVCLRYFNVFGPRQALDDEYAVVIPKFINCILNNQQPPIFGTGKQSRDFVYIDNVVEANILAARAPSPLRGEGKGEGNKVFHDIFNVASGHDTTILDLVKCLNKITGKNIQPKLLPIRAGDVLKTLASIEKVKTNLSFVPKVNFEEGLKRTVEYFRSQKK
ncbi:MAG: SDR family oxidoreductase [Candidatus Omnitrophota bacterium]